MNKTKYNQLREEIIKANEDILELVFGCKVASENGYFTIGGEAEIDIVYKGTPHERIYLITYGRRTDDFEIIGRDITLFDVYDTVEKIAYREVKGIKFRHTKFGEVKTFKDDEIKILHMWKRHKPLQDQSDECKELLYQLIVKK